MEKKNRRPGRPTIPEADKRRYRLSAKFSRREMEILKGKASKIKLTLYEFSRQAMLNAAVRPRITPTELQVYKDLLTESRNIGINLNIIAKKALSGLQRDYDRDISGIIVAYKQLISTYKQKLL